MPYVSTVLTTAVSSTPGASAICAASWLGGRPTTASVIPSAATSSGVFVLQYSLDDVQRTASSLVAWSGISSAQGQPATLFYSTTCYPDGVFQSFLSPVTAVRINSTNLNGGTFTLKVIEGEP